MRTEKYSGVLGVAEDPLVSTDIIQDLRASIVDLEMTQVIEGDLVKVMSWHDGEPMDIAYGALYLASDESKFVTDSELVIDGGYTAR